MCMCGVILLPTLGLRWLRFLAPLMMTGLRGSKRLSTSARAVVAVPACHWTDGTTVDLVRVGERARTMGAALIVDVCQAAGAIPIDVGRIQPDFLVSAAYKWLLGPYSVGFCWVAPHRREGRPLRAELDHPLRQ